MAQISRALRRRRFTFKSLVKVRRQRNGANATDAERTYQLNAAHRVGLPSQLMALNVWRSRLTYFFLQCLIIKGGCWDMVGAKKLDAQSY